MTPRASLLIRFFDHPRHGLIPCTRATRYYLPSVHVCFKFKSIWIAKSKIVLPPETFPLERSCSSTMVTTQGTAQHGTGQRVKMYFVQRLDLHYRKDQTQAHENLENNAFSLWWFDFNKCSGRLSIYFLSKIQTLQRKKLPTQKEWWVAFKSSK